ncbi:hypothetical protein B0H19DRAFT_1378465 [Mycena capillaripes]|nr:hypothetical protein B0H19DRAFT_1378465 [Mycena capillaripes]
MSDVPQELIDAIIKHVPDSSLVACSLTATAFVAPSQRRLFRWISLSGMPAYERIARSLASSPHLGRYVRHLALHIQGIPKDYAPLKVILPLFSEIERLSIGGDLQAKTNEMARNPCLIDLLSVPTLRSFALERISYVPYTLISRALSTFEEVLLSSPRIVYDEGLDGGDSPSPGVLYHFGFHGDVEGEFLEYLLHPSRVGFLQKLGRLSVVIPPIPPRLLTSFASLLLGCSPTLKRLELELDAPPLWLPTLPGLTVLELWLDVELTKTPDTLHTILSETMAKVPHLEVLTIAVLDRPGGPHRPNPQQWTGRKPWVWADLDSIWVDSDMADLREIHFSLHWFHHEPARYGEFVPFIQAHLPRTFDTKLIKFSYRAHFQHQMDKFVAKSLDPLFS